MDPFYKELSEKYPAAIFAKVDVDEAEVRWELLTC